jgi:hypothetical protein
MSPYRITVKNKGDKWEAKVFYEGKLINTIDYPKDYSPTIDGIDYTGKSKEGIEAELNSIAQNLGFYSTEQKKSYPSLNDLGISEPGDAAEDIDFKKILSILNIKIPSSPIPLPASGSLPQIPEIPEKLKLLPVTGIIVNTNTNEPLKGVQVISSLGSVKRTNAEGKFTIKVPSVVNTPLDPTKFNLKLVKFKFAQGLAIPYTSTKDVKPDLGIIQLNPLESNLKQEIIDLLTFKDAEVEKYATKDLTFEFHLQKKLNISIDELKKIVIPLILSLVAQYGLSKIQELIAEVKANGGKLTEAIKQQILCPLQDEIAKIIAAKNKLVKQLNNVLNSINGATQTLQISDTTVQSIDSVYQVLKVLPTPTAIGGVGIPISVINAVQDVKTFLNNNIGKIKQGIGGLSSILGILVEILTQVLDFLNFLDLITQFCAGEANTDQEQISKELTALTTQQSNQLSPVVTNVNGFTINVETEVTDQPLKRRRAIAQNRGGVIMLQGEWSYSSIDQILIDELVFYIQQNDLKAD